MNVFPGLPVGLPRAMGLWLLVAGLAFPTGSGAQESAAPVKKSKEGLFSRGFLDSKPPWAVEAPGGAGSRFGLGFDLFFEHQESLRITFMEQTLGAWHLLTGQEQSGVVRTDPGLLNRKFDLRWDLAGVGVQPAVALPLPPTLGLYPTLVFQAAAVDVSLDFRDRNRVADTSSLDGRGALFSTGLDLTRSLCGNCPWFAGASYRFQKLPDLNADRSPPFNPPGFEILEDEVQLSRDVHEASTRIGYGFSGNRVVSYLGASHRWTDVEIEDHLRYRDPSGAVETSLSSRTRLESEVTLALAGVEARLGPRLFSRLETSVGEGDWGVLLRVVYLPSRATTGPDLPSIAAQIRAIREEFVKSVNDLPEAVELAVLRALLDRTEKKLLAALPFPDFAAMHDFIRDRFRKAREMLAQGSAESTARAVPAALSSSRSISARLVAARLVSESSGHSRGVGSIIALLDLLLKRFENSDTEIRLCVRTEPAQRALVVLYPLSYEKGVNSIKSNNTVPLRRGLYAYRITRSGYEPLQCPVGHSEECQLDLMSRDRPLVECMLSKSKDDPESTCTVTDEPSGVWECKDNEL